MSAFDKIAGYDALKKEIEEICFLLKEGQICKDKGIRLPKGIFLYGPPGFGKTLFAECFAKESGMPYFFCRKESAQSDFIKRIVAVFEKAENAAPSIVILDDLDKYANEDDNHINAEEYVVIQSCIDKAKGKQVFVFATANKTSLIPDSLFRAGRFDRVLRLKNPEGGDTKKLLAYYLGKKRTENVSLDSFSKLLCGRSCAEIEEIVNDAAIYAFRSGRDVISREDMIRACVRSVYRSPKTIVDEVLESGDCDETVAYHEAGHVVVAEVLEPCSVTMVSLGGYEGSIQGFTAHYENPNYWKNAELMENDLCILLAGKCAIELTYGTMDPLCASDLHNASDIARYFVSEYASKGFQSYNCGYAGSSEQKMIMEREVNGIMENAYEKVKKILVQNRAFLSALASDLLEKKLLLEEDVQELKRRIQRG